MAIKISEVAISPQSATVGQTVTVTIKATDVDWSVLRDDFTSWENIRTEFTDWKSVLNYN